MPALAARLARDKLVTYYAAVAWFLFLFFVYFYLHELAGHYLANLIAGVPPARLSVLWARVYDVPVFPYAVALFTGGPTLFSRLAGGLAAGLVLLGGSFAWRRSYRRHGYAVLWWFAVITLGFALSGLLEGFVEGLFNEYHRRSGEALGLIGLTFLMPPLAGLWHFRATILGNLRKREGRDESD